MKNFNLPVKAGISDSGAILLGDLFEVDSYASRPVRIVTHMHSDHVIHLNKSKRHAIYIISTQATADALNALGLNIPSEKVITLNYQRPMKIADETVTLVKAQHVLGTAQVLVETSDGLRVGYTSDFKFPGTKIMKDLDALVIDATYGQEFMVRPFKNEVPELLSDLVNELLSREKPVRILGYHGKLQEVMEILRKNGVNAPFVMPKKIFQLTKIAEKHGMKISSYFDEESEEAKEIVKNKWYVYFQHANSYRRSVPVYADLMLSGWFFDSPLKKLYENSRKEEWIVAFSDHGDFKETLEYVEESKPKVLIIDVSRTDMKTAVAFSNAVRKKLNIEVIASPVASQTYSEED